MKKSVIILVGLGVFVLAGCGSKQPIEENKIQKEISGEAENSSNQLAQKEVLARMDAEKGTDVEQGEISVEIVSPTEKKFAPSQARMYKAEVDGVEYGFRSYCHWKFYLNEDEDDEEELYEEKDGTCHFTSTFIKDQGELRVHVDVEVKNSEGETIQTAQAEKKYQVE